MEDGSVVLETFQSEIVTDSDDDVNNDDDQTHLLPSNKEGRRKKYRERRDKNKGKKGDNMIYLVVNDLQPA